MERKQAISDHTKGKIMKQLKIIAVLILSMASYDLAKADDKGAYAGVGAETWDLDVVNIYARGGYMVTKNFGVEVDGSVGITDAQGAKVDSAFAGYAVGKFRVFRDFKVLGRIGYHKTNVSLENVGDGSVDSVAAGIGLEYAFSDDLSVRLDSTGKYIDDAEDAYGIVSLGVVRKF